MFSKEASREILDRQGIHAKNRPRSTGKGATTNLICSATVERKKDRLPLALLVSCNIKTRHTSLRNLPTRKSKKHKAGVSLQGQRKPQMYLRPTKSVSHLKAAKEDWRAECYCKHKNSTAEVPGHAESRKRNITKWSQ